MNIDNITSINNIIINRTFVEVDIDPCTSPSPRIKISLFLLSTCTDELISAPKTMTFFPMLASLNKNSERESNPLL